MVHEGVVIITAVLDTLEDVEDDRGETVLVEEDLLVIRDLANVAENEVRLGVGGWIDVGGRCLART